MLCRAVDLGLHRRPGAVGARPGLRGLRHHRCLRGRVRRGARACGGRMVQLGVRPMTSLQYLLELQRDWARSETYEPPPGSPHPRRRLWSRHHLRQDDVRRARRSPLMAASADLVLFNGRITTLDRAEPEAQAVAIRDGRFSRSARSREIMALAAPDTQAHRPERPPRDPRPDRQPHAHHPRRAELQHGAALGRRALARRRDGAC